jgi:hypothetical protein
MSETIQQETTEAPVTEAAPEPQETAAVETTQATEQSTEAAPESDQQPKPKQGDRRFAQMTARLSAKEAELERIKREYEQAQALLAAKNGTEEVLQPDIDIDAKVNERLAQREFEAKRMAVIQEGNKEFGKEGWSEKTEVLHGLGATQNHAFMQALVELPNAPRLVAHLADDADALVALLNKPPVAMAAEMGRLAAALPAEVRADPGKPLSAAPKPVKPVTAPAVVSEPTPYDSGLTMAQYVELRRKTAPKHLGGVGR